MAKSSDNGINKSEAIREVIAQNPKAGSKEVVNLLGQRGIKVSSTLVYYIMSKGKLAKRKQKREKVAALSRGTHAANPVELVLKVKALAREAGGINDLQRLVNALAE